MKKTHLLIIFLLSICQFSFAQNTCTNQRYLAPIFTSSVSSDIVYGEAEAVVYPLYISENTTYNRTMRLDLYTPDNDTLSKRPCIVMAFGGAFLVGSKTLQPQLVDFCHNFAQRGYVVASIDYRLGFNTINTASAVRAVYRAAQDMKAAIRFLIDNADVYGIDPELIYAGGNSAGGITAIHSAYVSETERAMAAIFEPTYGGADYNFINPWDDLGCVECGTNDLGQAPHNLVGIPKVVISLWGAIGDVSWMESATDAPIIMFHGTDDFIVSPNTAAPFDFPIFPALQGSVPISERADDLGMTYELHLFEGEGHEVWMNADHELFIREETADFLYDYMRPETPVIDGNTTICGTVTETYSVADNIGSVYCWNVSGGTIVSDASLATIQVTWDGNITGTIGVREINCNVVESDYTELEVAIVPFDDPTNLTATNITSNSANLTWDNATGLTFEVRYKMANTNNYTTILAAGNTTQLTALAACTSYEAEVRAICGGTNFSNYTTTYTFNTACIRAKVQVFLQGAYDNGTMLTDLRNANLLPVNQPYGGAPYNYLGTETNTTLPLNVVDWVLLELRMVANPTIVVDQAAGLLLNDGTIVDFDANADGVAFRNVVGNGDYYIVVRHRNHLDVMTNTPVSLPNTSPYNFTDANTKAYGFAQQTAVDTGIFALHSGDIDGNGVITNADFNGYTAQAGQLNQYVNSDCNLDGQTTIHDFNRYQINASTIGVSLIRY